MRNDHFLRGQRDEQAFIEQRIKRAEKLRHAARPTAFDWLLLTACGLVLGCAIAALTSLTLGWPS